MQCTFHFLLFKRRGEESPTCTSLLPRSASKSFTGTFRQFTLPPFSDDSAHRQTDRERVDTGLGNARIVCAGRRSRNTEENAPVEQVICTRLTGHALDEVLQGPEGDVGSDVFLDAVGVGSPFAQVAAFTARQVQNP